MAHQLIVNGLPVETGTSPPVVTDRILPLLAAMSPPAGGRAFAFLAGPPGSGKSTLAELIRIAAEEQGLALDVVGMDGFHHRQDYLASHEAVVNGRRVPLTQVKGSPESFDLERLDAFLTRSASEDVLWPAYDRTIHDVVDDRIPVTAPLVLLEGNWLLLDEPGWQSLRSHARLTIFVTAPVELLHERLVARKQAGGLSRQEAESFYRASDRHNVVRCLGNTTRNTDLTLRVTPEGQLEEVTQ